jgi:hypothetical protein
MRHLKNSRRINRKPCNLVLWDQVPQNRLLYLSRASTKHNSMLKKLKHIIEDNDDEIVVIDEKDISYTIRTKKKAVVNYYKTTRKVTFQGNLEQKNILEKAWEIYRQDNSITDKHEEINNEITEEEKESISILSNIDKSHLRRFLYRNCEEVEKRHKSSFTNEDDLKEWFYNFYKKWFVIHEDVKGIAYANRVKSNVISDFILEPKENLISKGITSKIGVEVKYINTKSNFLSQLSKLAFQTLGYSYCNSLWNIEKENRTVTTDVFIIFTNLSFDIERNHIFNTLDRKPYTFWKALISMIYHANVGELRINKSPTRIYSWYMYFSGKNYCYWSKEKGILLKSKQVIGKHEIGNIK